MFHRLQESKILNQINRQLQRVASRKYFSMPSMRQRNGNKDTGGKISIPEFEPEFEVRCNGEVCDCLETTDHETLHIIASNPYTNVTLKNLRIIVFIITDEDGNPVPNQPDGTPVAEIVPSKDIYFGDLPPCTPMTPSTKMHKVTFHSKGAKRGHYCFHIDYDVSVEFVIQDQDQFSLPLISS